MQHQVLVQLGKQIRVMENRLDKVITELSSSAHENVQNGGLGRRKKRYRMNETNERTW